MPAVAYSAKTNLQLIIDNWELIMKQFEYKVISSIVGTEKKLNKLGYEGWELVAVFDCRLYLKREYKE